MIPRIHDNKENYIGLLTDATRGIVIEERNGMFEAELEYQLFSPNWDKLVRGNIIVAHANDTLLNQKFRIYKVGKTIFGKFTVYAKHISYDMQRDMIDGLDISNQSCEYCLNMIFRNSQFSQKFRGHSDIINAQNYKIGATKLLSAIGGTKGSIIDTFGTGAEILRDNYDFYVLNKRGHDNDVIIEYSKNMTGLDYTEDEDGLITRIKAIAKYTPEGGEETEIFTYVDSPKILDYETPFIETIDFSDKFEDGEVPTIEKLEKLGVKYFKDNKCDFVKFNYKISFIPLSKCIGYEDIQDKIELCDTVGIKDYRYNLDTKAKVIKTTYDFLRERYDSMEVGEPRTTLGDVVGGGSEESKPGPPGPQGPPGADGNIGDFPDSLPATPVLNAKVYGFANIELSWTFENKIYYTYELYASKTKDFTPNTFDLIHAGQTSSFLFQAKPNETWYFRVCAINSHGNRTEFSSQVVVNTAKIDDLSNYVENMAISDALIDTLNLGRGWYGELRGNYIDAKNLSVTDGNGKRTLDIDSFGNVNLDVTKLRISSKDVATKDDISTSLKQDSQSIKIGFNGIDERVKFDVNGMSFYNQNSIKTTMLKLGNIYQYNGETGTFLGGYLSSRTRSSNNLSVLGGYHTKQWTVGRSSSWQDDTNNNPTNVTDYFFVNFVDVGSNRTGIHLASNTYAHSDIHMQYNDINNAGNIICSNLSTGNNVNCYRVIANTGMQTNIWYNSNGSQLMRYDGVKINLGASINTNGYSVSNSSDSRLKQDIQYVDKELYSTKNINLKTAFYNEFKEKFKFATYRYKNEELAEKEHFGFIAQDLLGTVFEKYILDNPQSICEEDDYLRYDLTELVTMIAGVLQEEIEIRDRQIEKLENRLDKIEQMLKISS